MEIEHIRTYFNYCIEEYRITLKYSNVIEEYCVNGCTNSVFDIHVKASIQNGILVEMLLRKWEQIRDMKFMGNFSKFSQLWLLVHTVNCYRTHNNKTQVHYHKSVGYRSISILKYRLIYSHECIKIVSCLEHVGLFVIRKLNVLFACRRTRSGNNLLQKFFQILVDCWWLAHITEWNVYVIGIHHVFQNNIKLYEIYVGIKSFRPH